MLTFISVLTYIAAAVLFINGADVIAYDLTTGLILVVGSVVSLLLGNVLLSFSREECGDYTSWFI